MVTGYKTAMTRTKPSAPLSYLLEHNLISGKVLDYGCGKGMDVSVLQERQFDAQGYDPHWSPEMPKGDKWDTVLCFYVLNVVDSSEQAEILEKLNTLGNKVFIAVRRDLPERGAPGRDCYQRSVECPLGYRIVFQNKSFAIFQKP